MKIIRKSILTCVVVMVAALASAQTCFDQAHPENCFNPPPCDFSSDFYNQNGVRIDDATLLVGRFGPDRLGNPIRQFGPPSIDPTVPNWVADTNCSANDPTRRDIRILATTGAFAAKYFSIIAFMVNSDVFEKSNDPTRPLTFPAGGGTVSFDTNGANPRGYKTQFILQSFLAFAAPTQQMFDGTPGLAPTPCGSLHDTNFPVSDCFTVGKTASGLFAVDTPNLRQDWNIQTLNNAMDGSDLNCADPAVCGGSGQPRLRDSPFGYFCDDLLGAWLIRYWWFTENAIGGTKADGTTVVPNEKCTKLLCCAHAVNGDSLDHLPAMVSPLACPSPPFQQGTFITNTPVIKNENQLNFLKGVSGTPAFGGSTCNLDPMLDLPGPTEVCVKDGAISATGGDMGAVWLICPALDDPQNGAIAQDAFLDAVRKPDGSFLDNRIAANFNCLKQKGKFANPDLTCP